MTDFWKRLKQRKIVQWAIAYVAFAFALIQVVDVVADSYGWPHLVMHFVFGILALGLVVMLVLAWYHGERGAQHVSGPELLLIALALAIGGGLLWHFGHAPVTPGVARAAATTRGSHPATATAVGTMAGRTTAASVPRGSASTSTAPRAAAEPIPAKSVAVLPFENLSADKNNEYFAAGMQDLILTKLADIGDLKVIARTSTEKYQSHPDDLEAIGQQLGVATILEGSVQKAGNEVLINVQLIDANTDAHIWAQSYTRKLDNIFGVEGEVAGKIASALNAKLSSAETAQLAAVPTTNPAAYDLFLRADFQTRRADITFDPANLKAAIPLYREATAKDPKFALAYARLSFAESSLAGSGGGGEDVKQLAEQARIDAERALQLAPNLPASQLALGWSDYAGKGDYTGALKHFGAALALRPNDADALVMRGDVEREQGRFDAAIASLKRAVELDPRNPGAANELGAAYMFIGHYSEAERWFRRATALDPNSLGAQYNLAKAIVFSTGDVVQALRTAQGNAPALKLMRVSLLTLQRKYPVAITVLESIPDTFHGVSFFHIPKVLRLARLCLLSGDTEQARALFEQASSKARARLAQTPALDATGVWQNLATAELGLGHTAAALHDIGNAQGIVAKTGNRANRPSLMERNASLYAEAKRPDLAVPLLAKALATPGIGFQYSPVLLWLDPVWDPIRHDPGFQALLKKYAKYKPEAIPVVPASAATSGGGADG